MIGASILTAWSDPALFQPWFVGESWSGWRTVLKAVYGLPMSEPEKTFFRSLADRDPPTAPVKEAWFIVGRRGGKDSFASVIAAATASLFADRHLLRRGERALVMCLATDRQQAGIVLNYTRSYFSDIAMLQGMVQRETANGFELTNGVDIAVSTNSYRSVRGRPILCAILDEVSFWQDERSANPDQAVFDAIAPGLATLPGSILIGISSPYRKSGLLYNRYRDHYGKDGDILVVRAPTRVLNPLIDQSIIDRAMADDPVSAGSEWMAEFRNDVAAYVTRASIENCVDVGVTERSPSRQHEYFAFTDPAGGSGADSFTLAIAHLDGETVVLDALREQRPPFSPAATIAQFTSLLRTYSINSVTGDRYAGEFPRELFRQQGVQYRLADLNKSQIYIESLPRLNSGTVRILENERLISQLLNLERRNGSSGHAVIDHRVRGHDDLSNAAMGVCAIASERKKRAFSGTIDHTGVITLNNNGARRRAWQRIPS